MRGVGFPCASRIPASKTHPSNLAPSSPSSSLHVDSPSGTPQRPTVSKDKEVEELRAHLGAALKKQKEAEALSERLKADMQRQHGSNEQLRKEQKALEEAFEKLRSRYEATKEAEQRSRGCALFVLDCA